MAHHLERMFAAHPRRERVKVDVHRNLAEKARNCADVCIVCADACLGEDGVKELVRCIRLNLDCAEHCATTALGALRLTEPDHALMRHHIEVCEHACRVCAEECDRHASKHDHCRHCAETCRECEQACRDALQSIGG